MVYRLVDPAKNPPGGRILFTNTKPRAQYVRQ